jgi:fimbrial chaperone protein
MGSFTKQFVLAVAGLSLPASALASDLRIAPASVEAHVGSRTATINVVNGEQRPLKAQIRVMRWTQETGQDKLTPTTDLVASPPFVTLKAGERYVIRLVQVKRGPIQGEESYRVLIDEVPEPHTAAAGTVNFLLRQSVPVFFSDLPRRSPKVGWQMAREGSNVWLVGRNTGNRRIRISDVTIGPSKAALYHQPGLLGYVLPNSEMRWPIGSAGTVSSGGPLPMSAVSDVGPVDVALETAAGK